MRGLYSARLRKGWGTLARFAEIFRRICFIAALLVVVAGAVVALWPEPRARLLTIGDWTTSDSAEAFHPSSNGPQWLQLRASVLAEPRARLARNYTPVHGVGAAKIISPPFRGDGLLSVLTTGMTFSPGEIETDIECSSTGRRLAVGRGGMNVNFGEVLVRIPRNWCAGDMRIRQRSSGRDSTLAGVGSAFALDAISSWKISFLGLLPYLLLSLGAFGLIGAAGALLFSRLPPVLGAGVGIAFANLSAFFICALAPTGFSPLAPIVVFALSFAIVFLASPVRRRATFEDLLPYGAVWFALSLGAFTLLNLVYSGVGHWEPNHRFAPAGSFSDNELPWLYAEALRHGWDLQTLFGGGWRPADRPPLLAGGDLLLGDLFQLLRSVGTDGEYLRGMTYNAMAIAQNALWAPAFLYVLIKHLGVWPARGPWLVACTALLPFFLANTIYGWPKLLGGAFGVLAAVCVLAAIERKREESIGALAAAFGVCSGASILAHSSNALFLLPLSIWFFFARLWRRPAALAIGVGASVALLAPWYAYEHLIAPSNDPLLRSALTGDFGFGDGRSVWEMVRDRYVGLTWPEWLQTKAAILTSPFHPTDLKPQYQPPRGADVFGYLRAWDMFHLSGVNLVLLAGIVFAWLWRRSDDPSQMNARAHARGLVLVCLACFALCVLLFLTPLVSFQMPYALLTVLAAVSFAALGEKPIVMAVVGVVVVGYAAIVWVGSPLLNAYFVMWWTPALATLLVAGAVSLVMGAGPTLNASADR
jgi:hypothetical protein